MNSDMKIKRKLIMAAAVVTMLSANAFAQNPTGRVEVRKDYQADLTGAKKGIMKIDFSDTLRKFDLNMDYRIKDKQLRDLYAFSPMPSAGISSREKEQIPSFFAKAGISFPLAPTFALWYQPTLSVNSDMVTLKASHDSYHGKARIADINASDKVFATKFDTQAKEWKNTVGASYTHLWKNAQLNADFNFRNGHNTYYGADLARNTIYDIAEYSELAKNKSFMKDNLSHDYNQVEVALSANSMDSEDYQGKFHYDGQLSFTSTADDSKFYANSFKLKENLLKASLEAGPTVGKYSMVTAGIRSETAFYKDAQNYHFSLLEGTLVYRLRRDRLSMDLGARISFSFNNKDGSDKYHNYISPKVNITYKLDEGKTWAYAMADGGNVINSYASMLERFPYISPMIDIRESGTPLFAKAGFKGKATQNLDYDVYAGGAYRKGMLQFAGNPLDAVYSNHAEGFIGGRLNYRTTGFAAGASAKYSFYTDGEKYRGSIPGPDGLPVVSPLPSDYPVKCKPAGYPPFEGNLWAEVNFNEKLFVGTTLYVRSATPASPFLYNGSKIKYKGYADLGLYAQYIFDNHLTVYINGGNLLNADKINYGMYVERGINVGFGVLVNL